MFDKKQCRRCGKKVRKEDSFCPNCGISLNDFDTEEEWGLLGKNDIVSPRAMMPGFNMLFNSIMKDIGTPLFKEMERELKGSIEKNPKQNSRGIRISISNVGNNPPKISINNLNGEPIKKKEISLKKTGGVLSLLSEEKAKEFASLPKEEPMTKI